jgi:hypothetical protein
LARIRTVKPEFWTSEQVMNLKRDTRLMFIGLWNFCDDAGRHIAEPRRIKAQVFPGDDDISSETIRGMLQELSTNDLIALYEVSGKTYLQVTGWRRHQRIDKPQKSNIPEPGSESIPGMIVERSTNTPGSFATEGNGEERKIKEQNPYPPLSIITTASPMLGVEGYPTKEVKEAKNPRYLDPHRSITEDDEIWLNLRADIVRAYEHANIVGTPDTSIVEVWRETGYSPRLILAVIKAGLKPGVFKSLTYWAPPIAREHETKSKTVTPIKPREPD